MKKIQLHKTDRPGEIILEGISIIDLSTPSILSVCSEMIASDIRGFYDIHPTEIRVDFACFERVKNLRDSAIVQLEQNDEGLHLTCTCLHEKKSLCPHEAQVLFNVMNRDEIRIFFESTIRKNKLSEFAQQAGIGQQEDPELYFQLEYYQGKTRIIQAQKELLLIDPLVQKQINEQLLINQTPPSIEEKEELEFILVFRKHRFYEHLCIELCEAGRTREGKLKKPIRTRNPFELIWKFTQPDELKFFSAIARFANLYEEDRNESDLEAMKAIFRNPLNLKVYLLPSDAGDSPSLTAYEHVNLHEIESRVHLQVDQRSSLYSVKGEVELNGRNIPFEQLRSLYGYFFRLDNSLYFHADMQFIRLMEFFRQKRFQLLIPAKSFEEFRIKTLSPLEDRVRITYAHLKTATEEQKVESGLNEDPEPLLYLSQAENEIQLIPAMRYGPVEVPVLSQKQIYSFDDKGNAITIVRDEQAETKLLATLLLLIPELNDQLDSGKLCIHKTAFLDENWFPDFFESLTNKNIRVLGFNELTKQSLNMHKAKINVQVKSGLDWFETAIDVRFGKQRAKMKQLVTAVRNKSRYVQLDDGTQGILPQEWLERFTRFFHAGIVASELLKTPRIRFQEVMEVYDWNQFDVHTQMQLNEFSERLKNFREIEVIELPKGLNAQLRAYQKEGLNWLNFLHQFGFGGCLADDMGLGKTLQIIAFIQHLKEKGEKETHLIVVPATLIFNWQEEFKRFTPELNIHIVYGSARSINQIDWTNSDVLITSYGVLQSEIAAFKNFPFHLAVLDESQAIKNPETLRYRAVCQIKAQQRLVLTGTPLENNTFDLFGQLSFACPGLLGTKQQFKLLFSIPIDTFKDSKRAKELSRIVSPFVLRRTKNQVARELPQKTEMLVYCEMGDEQRRIYDAYTKELRDFIANKQSDEINRNSMYVLRGLTRLRQICNAPALLNEKNYFSKASAKIEVLMEHIEQHAPEHKILVFSQFVGMLELIQQELKKRQIPHELLSGKSRNRKQLVSSFKENEDVRVFLISLKAGGTGLNLTEADYVYLVDPWWNPAVENQAIDRAHRIGQKNRVVAVRLICPDTIEDKIRLLQESKQQLISELIQTENGLLKGLDKKSLLDLLSPLN
ncbi:MAG TPA: DEAD/DEAH box helicase [Flavobacteriales bacterium]|nr:DEAD/DEAH box helicase [Flavobacteriales bacterium]